MGLFSSKSKSTSTTNFYDYSKNMNVDLSSGDVGGSDNNIISAGDVYYAGMSEELAKLYFNALNQTTNSFIDGSLELVDNSVDLTKKVLDEGNKLFNDTFGWIQETIGSSQQQTAQVTSALTNAYNSEQATFSQFKTFALYGLLGFVAWAYFTKKR